MKRTPLMAANWKMNGTLAEAKKLLEALLPQIKNKKKVEVLICPPATVLFFVREFLTGTGIKLGAQNFYFEVKGAFTGEISAAMLLELSCEYVIVGHSERRNIFGEGDELVNKKIRAALKAGLKPIICVGESLSQREKGATDSFVISQVKAALAGVTAPDLEKTVFAYEPIWAIGTGKTCDSKEANRVIKLIRSTIAGLYNSDSAEKTRILYGGSIKADTIDDQMSQSDVDGGLVGGASLVAGDFARIVNFKQIL
jgi:triosephosphate isomerase